MFFGGMPFDDMPGGNGGHPGMRGGGRQREPANTTELYEVIKNTRRCVHAPWGSRKALAEGRRRGGACRSTGRDTT